MLPTCFVLLKHSCCGVAGTAAECGGVESEVGSQVTWLPGSHCHPGAAAAPALPRQTLLCRPKQASFNYVSDVLLTYMQALCFQKPMQAKSFKHIHRKHYAGTLSAESTVTTPDETLLLFLTCWLLAEFGLPRHVKIQST